MVQPFRVPFNKPKGTTVADGYRVAPDFNTFTTSVVNAAGQIYSNSSYKNYGPGMLLSPITTMNFTPFGTAPGNVVAAAPVTGDGWLTLTGSPLNDATSSVTKTATTNAGMFPPTAPNNFYLQLDWPRVPTVTVSGGNLGAQVRVTFFGYDWYDRPLQHTYTIQNSGTYPGPITNVAGLKGKAFYKITAVYFGGTDTAAVNISCQVSNTFGLPYVLKNYGDMNQFSWGGLDMRDQGGSALLVGGTANVQTPAARAILDAKAAAGGMRPQLSLSHLDNITAVGELFVGVILDSTQALTGNFVFSSAAGADASHVSWSINNGARYIVAPADTTDPSATTGDVRGLFELPFLSGTNVDGGLLNPETWAAQPNGNIQAIFSYYCEGFDTFLNILNAGQQPQWNGVDYTFPNDTTNKIVPPNLVKDMYGLDQYYTGVPLP
jgi:hypothetical protein